MAFGNRLSPRDDDIVNAELRELNAVQLDLDFGVAHQCKARGDRQIHPTLTAKHGRRSVRRQTAPEYVAQTPAPRRDGPRSKQRFLETGEREVERKRHQQPLTVALMLSKCGETKKKGDSSAVVLGRAVCLRLNDARLSSLEGLELCRSVRVLYLYGNGLKEILGFPALKHLESLFLQAPEAPQKATPPQG